MKKLLSPISDGGLPVTNKVFLTIQDNIFASLYALLQGIGSPMLLTGMNAFNITTSPNTCSVEAGTVWLAGEVRQVPYTSSTTYPFYVIPAPDVYEQARFANGVQQNAFVTKSAQITTTIPSTGEYLAFNPYNYNRPNATITAQLSATVQTLQDAYDNLRDDLGNEINTRISADQSLESRKATRVKAAIPWTNLTLNAPFTAASSAFFYPPQFCRTEDGFVHLRGQFIVPAGQPNPASNSLATLPPGTRCALLNVFDLNSAANEYQARLQVNSTELFLVGFGSSGTGKEISLAGINWYTDI